MAISFTDFEHLLRSEAEKSTTVLVNLAEADYFEVGCLCRQL